MYSEAQKRASVKYNKANYKLVSLQLRLDSDQDLIDLLEKNRPSNAFIKKVLREYIKKDLK